MSMISEQIEELRLMAEMFVNGEPYGNLLRRAANTIEMLSEKAREPKRGEWILLEPRYPIEQKVYWNKEQALADTKGNGARERRKCSCCGYTKSFMCHMKDEQIKLWNFCPNCGADMREKEGEW